MSRRDKADYTRDLLEHIAAQVREMHNKVDLIEDYLKGERDKMVTRRFLQSPPRKNHADDAG